MDAVIRLQMTPATEGYQFISRVAAWTDVGSWAGYLAGATTPSPDHGQLVSKLREPHSNAAMSKTFNSKSKISSFGHFLENKSKFLESISKGGSNLQGPEQKLVSIINERERGLSSRAGLGNFNGLKSAKTENSLEQMLLCGMHLGHATFKWSPKMAPFIYGERAGIHIIDLEKTFLCLRQACHVVMDIAAKGGTVLFVGTEEKIQRLTYECAEDAGQFYVNLRWIGGTITNRSQVLRNDKISPDIMIVLDPKKNMKAITEAKFSNIPVIAICDTDCDPTDITYPIPANDDSFASIELVAKTLSRAAKEGRERSQVKQSRVVDSATSFIEKVFGESF